ncbi:MAG TPA: SBBP repeat-containing protein [Dongiaceae bacterium]|nr:SBBP repeat-containing protein [Dongiaceae bacterium]
MNVDRRWWGTSMLGVRILVAGLALLVAGGAVLGWGTHIGKIVRNGGPLRATLDAKSLESPARARSILAGLPLIFEPNQGQANLDPADPRAQFVTHGPSYSMVLGSDGAILSLVSNGRSATSVAQPRVQTLHMKLAGANPQTRLIAADRLPGKSNYFIGNNPSKWRTGVPQFARVRYESVYPGIDLVFYGNEGHLEYDFQVAPGADPAQAELEFNGAGQLDLRDGSLLIGGDDRSVRLDAPVVYQEIDGRRKPVEGAFVLRGANRAGFAIGAYDHSRELIIDPILNFSTYFGGSGDEHNTSVAVDGSLNIYLTGSTTSANLPASTGAVQTTLKGTQNVYAAKIQPPLGSQAALLLEMTYLGGSGTDYPVGIKVDGAGDPYVAGTTTSGDFPTTATNAYQSVPEAGSKGTSHVFVTRLTFDFTNLSYSSYLSGNGTDIASGMTIDSAGALYVTGTTTSSDVATSAVQFPASTFPQKPAYQSQPRAATQFFVTKVDTTAPGEASIPYSTYFGGGTFNGTLVATGGGIAVDSSSSANIYFTGTTNFTYSGCAGCSTTDFPILNAYQPCLDAPPATTVVNPPSCANTANPTLPDAFAAKLNPNAAQGQQLIWSTYLGGSETDSSTGIALDSGAANVYVVGTTNSSDFVPGTTVNNFGAFQKCLNNSPLTTTILTSCGQTATNSAPTDAFVARINNLSSGTTTNLSLNYFSYVGGANSEQGLAVTVDANSGAMVTGSTQSPYTGTDGTFPVTPFPSSIQSNLNGTQDAFIARLNTGAVVGQTTTASWASYFGGTGIDAGTGITLDVNGNSYLAGETNSTDLQVAKPLATNGSNAGGYDSFVTQFGTAVSISIQGALSLGTGQQYISAGNPATFTYTVTNNGPDAATGIVVTDNLSSEITGVTLSNVSASISSGTCGSGGSTSTSISCGPISLQSGSTATVTITATPTGTTSGAEQDFNGGAVQAIGPGNIILAQTTVPAKMSDFTMSVSPSNQSKNAGETATYTVLLTPHPVFASSITVSCSGLPNASSCPSQTVTLSNTSGASVALNVTTTARITTTGARISQRHFYALWLMIPGIVLAGMSCDRRRRRLLGVFLLCVTFALVLLLPACSSSKSQTPPSGTQAGNYTLTITAASGGDSKTQTVTLNVL